LGAASYNVKRANASGGPYAVISTPGTVMGTNYTDSTAVNGKTYYYVVSAATLISPAAETANSPTETSVTLPTPPPAPLASYNSPMYAGMTLYLSASTVAGASYSWSGPGGFVSTNQNPSLSKAGPSASGIYAVTVTIGGLTSTPGSVAVSINPPLVFSIQRSSSNLIFNWAYGTLEFAPNLSGPWNSINEATSPWTNTPAGPQEFYRVQLQ
jgi:hypothetical protein